MPAANQPGVDERFEPYPGDPFDDKTYTGDAYPAFGWASAVAAVDVDHDTRAVAVRIGVAADAGGRVIHPVLAQVEGGTLQAVDAPRDGMATGPPAHGRDDAGRERERDRDADARAPALVGAERDGPIIPRNL